MKTHRIVCALPLLVGLAGCNKEGDSYLFLADLCSTYAQDVCSARAQCCDADNGCISEVEAACEAVREELVTRSELRYNAGRAGDARARSVEQLTACDAPLPVSAFFDGTLPLDTACSDDLACASGHCEFDAEGATGRCAEPGESLCPAL